MKSDSMQIIFHPSQKVTPWFDIDDPVHAGVYERDIYDLQAKMPMYGYYDGTVWYQTAHSPEKAAELHARDYQSVYQLTHEGCRWRGLSRKP